MIKLHLANVYRQIIATKPSVEIDFRELTKIKIPYALIVSLGLDFQKRK